MVLVSEDSPADCPPKISKHRQSEEGICRAEEEADLCKSIQGRKDGVHEGYAADYEAEEKPQMELPGHICDIL